MSCESVCCLSFPPWVWHLRLSVIVLVCSMSTSGSSYNGPSFRCDTGSCRVAIAGNLRKYGTVWSCQCSPHPPACLLVAGLCAGSSLSIVMHSHQVCGLSLIFTRCSVAHAHRLTWNGRFGLLSHGRHGRCLCGERPRPGSLNRHCFLVVLSCVGSRNDQQNAASLLFIVRRLTMAR